LLGLIMSFIILPIKQTIEIINSNLNWPTIFMQCFLFIHKKSLIIMIGNQFIFGSNYRFNLGLIKCLVIKVSLIIALDKL